MGLLDFVSPAIGGITSIVGLISAANARAQAQREQQAALNQMAVSNDQQYQNVLQANQRSLYGAAGDGANAIRALGSNLGSDMAGAGVYNSSATAGAITAAQAREQGILADLAARNQANAAGLHAEQAGELARMRLGQGNTDYQNANAGYQNSAAGMGQFLGGLSTVLGQQQAARQAQQAQSVSAGGPLDPGTGIGGWPGGTVSVLPEAVQAPWLLPGGWQAAMQQPAESAGFTPAAHGGYGMLGGANPMPAIAAPIDYSGISRAASSLGQTNQTNLGQTGANAARTQLPQVNGTVNQGANLAGNAGGIGNGGIGTAGGYPFLRPGQIPLNPYAPIAGR